MQQIISPARESATIAGVYTVALNAFHDERGRFIETFRREWFPWIDWSEQQGNRSDSRANVLRGLHFHHHQIDYWYLSQGVVRAGLADLRRSSPTFGATQVIEMNAETPMGLFVPIGVAHGFYTLTEVTLHYLVNRYYAGGADENGVAWDDPDLALAWGADDPIVSERDAANPRWHAIPAAAQPE